MMKLGTLILVGGLVTALPLNAQSHGTHQQKAPSSAQQAEQRGTHEKPGHEHCEKHAAKHGAQSDAAHAAHGSAASKDAHAAHSAHGTAATKDAHAAHGNATTQHAAHASHGASDAQAAHGMMEQHRTAPKMLLKHREMLQLTAAQVEQLESMQAAHKADCEKRMAAVKAAETAAAAALGAAAPDLGTYEAKLREAANHKVDCKVDMARMSQAGAALLTDAQRGHLAHMQHAAH